MIEKGGMSGSEISVLMAQHDDDDSINYNSFICIKLNVSKYCYVQLTIQLNICYLFTHIYMISFISNNSI